MQISGRLNIDLKSTIAFGMDDDLTIAKIIKNAGGPGAVQRAYEAHGLALTRDAVYKWQQTGIPDRHWPIIISLTTYGPSDLYEANCRARDAHSAREVAA